MNSYLSKHIAKYLMIQSRPKYDFEHEVGAHMVLLCFRIALARMNQVAFLLLSLHCREFLLVDSTYHFLFLNLSDPANNHISAQVSTLSYQREY